MNFGQKFEGGALARNLAARKHENLRDFGRLRDLISNISGTQQGIVIQAENGVAKYGRSRTGKLNLVYFGPHRETSTEERQQPVETRYNG